MAKLTQEDWAHIEALTQEIGETFEKAKTMRILSLDGRCLHVPECCFPGKKDYDTIIQLKREIKRIKDGRNHEEKE